MNLLSSNFFCSFKDKKIRVLTNLLVAHLCCEANSFLACATSVKPTAYYPIITNLNNAYQFKSNLSIKTLYRLCNLNRIWYCPYSLYTLLRPLKMSCVLGRVSSFSPVCAINNRFISHPQSFTAFFRRGGMGSEHTTAGSWEYDWQLGDAPRQLGWLKWRHALLSPPTKERKDRSKGINEMKRYWEFSYDVTKIQTTEIPVT